MQLCNDLTPLIHHPPYPTYTIMQYLSAISLSDKPAAVLVASYRCASSSRVPSMRLSVLSCRRLGVWGMHVLVCAGKGNHERMLRRKLEVGVASLLHIYYKICWPTFSHAQAQEQAMAMYSLKSVLDHQYNK